MRRFVILSLLFTALVASCMQPATVVDPSAIPLTSFSEHYVTVDIRLKVDDARGSILSATFTPPAGYHLYSKDIPLEGMNGLGRPTLLELPSDSQLEIHGGLIESVMAQIPDFEPRELLVYPAGPVTLSLKVRLPSGYDSFDDSVIVTYMACTDQLCKPPVVGKIVPIRIPAADTFDNP